VLQHLICIKIGTVVLLTDLFPHFLCLLNYWDMGYCIVILSIFRDIFGFCPKINFRDMGYLPIHICPMWWSCASTLDLH
jgi:hypothetical protein